MSEVAPYSRLAGVYDEIVVDPCFGRWAGFLDHLWQADPGGVAAVLDVCCGTGLLAAELVARGYRVTGVDASVAMLARARRRLGPDAVLELVVLPDLPAVGRFDAAVSTFDGLNYLDQRGFWMTMAGLAERLRPGGWLVFDLHTDAMLQLALHTPTVAGEQDGTSYVIHNVVDLGERTCDARIQVTGTDAGEPFSERHRQYFHTDAEVRAALAAAGFEQVAVTEEYTRVPVDENTLRATWTARRRLT
ncbi:MAG: class I SAM-dependent methyltransferase [Propionicimonas sp.]|nr:class I SAM-dependent methyltransferase [Propionicimonas sp.]